MPSTLRTRLIFAALNALGRGEEVGLRSIARDVGVSAMAPYRHFADKSALLAATVRHGFGDLRAALQSADHQPNAIAALVAQGEAYIAFARDRPALFRLMFSGRNGVLPPVEDSAYGVMVNRVQQLGAVDLDVAALACWSAVHGMATLAIDGGLPPGGSARERAALTLVISGLEIRSDLRTRRATPSRSNTKQFRF